MFPHNNNPFQQNLLGPPYGQPPVFPPRMAQPRMSNPIGMVPPGLPQNMSTAPPSILPGQPSVFQNTRALSSSSQSYHPTGMSNQRFPTHNQSQGSYAANAPTSTVPGQGKDNVTKMTVDFIKQFQEQVAKRKVTEEKNNRMKVQSKASVQRQTLRDDRDGSPFSDVSDSDLAGGTNKPAEPAPLKGILRNKAPQQPVSSSTSTNPGQSTMSARNTGSSSNQYSTQTSAASKPQASTGLSSILKNYEESRRSSSSQRGSRSETTQSSEQTGKSIPTLTRSDSSRDRSRSAQRYDSGKSGALQDVSDNEGNSDEIHVQSQVFVGNLPNVTEDDMLSYFSKYRIEVWIGRHRRDKTKACAFVKTETMKEARELIAEFKHGRFKGNNLHVRYTAASDFENYKVATLADMRRDISPEPTRDSKYDSSRERQYDSTADQQQVYYTPVQQVPQYLPNTGDGYSMPVYLVPPSMPQTQQVFIPAGAYPVDFQGPQSHYDTPDYGSQISDTHSRHSRDYSPVPERRKYMVYVGNLPINLSLASLEAYLTKQNHCGINLKSKDGQAYAFVDFYDYEDARNMVRELDNKKCYGRNIHVRMGDEEEPVNLDGKNRRDRDKDRDRSRDRSRDRDGESEKERKSLFKGYVDAAFANAPLLGKKYITEYLSTKETRAVYVCSVCMEMSYGSEVAEHIVGYRHRLKCFRKDEPNIYDKMCRIREKSKMMMECARMAADYEILREKIMIQMCIDPEERAKKHLDNIKDASFIGSRKSKDKESSPAKESRSSSSSSSMDIFKRIAMHKKKLEETKKDDKKKDTRSSSETQSSKSKSLADKIVGQIASRQKEEDNVRVDTKTKEMERKKEEEKQWKIMEAKQKEADMKKRLEEARQKVIENQKKLEEDRKKKAEEERKRKEDERRAEEDRKRKLEEKRIEEEKRKLAEQKRKLEQERRELEQQKLQEAKKRALEDVKKKEEDMKRQQEEEKLRKEQEEQQKVELMLQMLEQQKREEEEARKLEEEKHGQLQEEQRQAELKRQEEIAKAERLKLEEQRRKLEKFEREKNEAEAIKKRNLQLHVLKEMEEKRRKDMQAEQKRQAALKRVEEIKKADTGTGGAKVIPEFPLIYDQKYFDQYENELSFEQKLVQAKRKGYMTLPFSMEEKRMFLKSNLGPYDKIGPDPNSKIDSVLALKYNMKGADFPLIGLQYIVEGFEGKEMSNSSHRYFCELCCIESSNCDGVIQHVIGFVHRKKYLEIHKADEYAQLMQQDLRRGTLNELTKQKAINIEHESGRHQIPTLAMFEFRALVIKMKEVEMAYKNQSQKPDPKLAPKNHDEIVKVKKMIEMSEKDDITQTDQSVYDPTLNVQANLNRMVAAACVVKLEEGWTWVEFYKYLDQRKITNEPLLGLQYITEVRGNKRYAPKYTCNLCDMTTLNSPDKVIEHLNSKDHLIKVLNFMHPEKIVGNPLLERKLTDVQRTEVLRNIARSATAGRKERESLKVGVLLVENVWRTWHEQSREDKPPTMSQEDIEFEEELQQEGDNLRPELICYQEFFLSLNIFI